MADTKPTPAPQDAAATTAPPQDTAQGPVIQSETDLTPTQQAVQVNPSILQMPATAQPAAPSTPTAPATGAQASPKVMPKRGLMQSVLSGALDGAVTAMKAAGKGALAVAETTRTGQDIKTQNLARKAKQQEMAQSKQQAADTHALSLDTQTENKIRINSAFLDNAHKAAENSHIESLWATQDASTRESLLGQVRAQNEADRKFLTTLEESGVHLDTSHFAQGGAFDQLTPDHAKAVANGKQWGLSNGLTGQDADIAFVSNAELANTVLPHDVSIVTDWNIDPKTGNTTPVYSTLKAGENTALDAVIAHDAGMDKFNQKQNMYTKQIDAQQKAAQAEQQRAEAGLNEAEMQNLKNIGVTVPPNFTPNPNSFSLSAPQLQQTLTTQGVKIPGNFQALYAAAHYNLDPNTFPARPYNRPGAPPQMGKDDAISFIRAFMNPHYDDSNYTAVKSMEKEFADTRPNTAGGNLIAFNTATGHLGQLYDASFAMQNGNIVALNKIANSLGVATGQSAPVVYNAIRNVLVGELGKTFKGAAADIPEADRIIQTLDNSQSPQQTANLTKAYAHAMLTKAGAIVAHYYSYTGHLPPQTIDPNAAQVYQHLGIDVNSIFPAGATTAFGGTGNQNPGSNQNVVPQGKFTAKDANGNVVGYADDAQGTNYHPF